MGLCEQKKKSKEPSSLNNTQLTSAMNGNPAKKIKLEDEDDPHTSSRDVSHDQWLYHELRLTKEEKSAIVDGKRLNDKHISFAQNLLKIQFPEVEGLKPTIVQGRFKLDSSKHIVQILATCAW